MANNDRNYILALAVALTKSSENISSQKIGDSSDISNFNDLSIKLFKKYIETNSYFEDYISIVPGFNQEIIKQTKSFESTIKYDAHINDVKKLVVLQKRIVRGFDYSYKNASMVRICIEDLEKGGKNGK